VSCHAAFCWREWTTISSYRHRRTTGLMQTVQNCLIKGASAP
jgi:hypothetical protein